MILNTMNILKTKVVTEKSDFDFVRYKSFSLTLYKVIGGTNKSEQIDFNEFMR